MWMSHPGLDGVVQTTQEALDGVWTSKGWVAADPPIGANPIIYRQVISQPIAPTNPGVDYLWWDESTDIFKRWNGTSWVASGGSGNATSVTDATATAKGIVELATDAETLTGTDTARVVTPASLAAKLATLPTALPALSQSPFSRAIAFTTPVKANPVLDSNNTALVAALSAGGQSRALNVGLYGISVYEVEGNETRYAVGDASNPLFITNLGAGAADRSAYYQLGTPIIQGGFTFVCTVPGTTAGSAPTFPTAVGATVVDGGVTWKNVGANSSGWGDCDLAHVRVPIPAGAAPAPGTDGHMVIVDRTAGVVYNLVYAAPISTGGGVISGGTVVASETWTGSNGAAWPAQWSSGGYGTGAAATIQGNAGAVTITAGGFAAAEGANITSLSATDVDVVCTLTMPATTDYYADVRARLSAGGNWYGVRFRSGDVQIMSHIEGGSPADVSHVTTSTGVPAPSATIKFRFRIKGNVLKARWWTGTTEPTTWNLNVTDAANRIPAAGSVGFGINADGAGSAARTLTVDDLTVTSGASENAGGTVTGWTCGFGGVYPLGHDGSSANPDVAHKPWPGPYSRATGSGAVSSVGLVTAAEIAAGVINHALFFSSNMTAGPANTGPYRYPATTTDGVLTSGTAIAEGTRIYLDCTDAELVAAVGSDPVALMIGRALRIYGAYCMDKGGARIAINCETPNTAAKQAIYTAAGITGDYYFLNSLPWNKLKVQARWDGN